MPDGIIEESGILEYGSEFVSVALEREIVDIRSIDENMARFCFIESHEKLYDGGFTTPSMSDECYSFSFLDLKIDTREYLSFTGWIGESEILELDRCFYGGEFFGS